MFVIKGIELGLMTNALFEIINLCPDLPGNDSPEKVSGFFTVLDTRTGEIVKTMEIGKVPEEKREKYYKLSQEKAKRLYAHPEHLSSWQSRNPDQGEWGGSIRIENYIFSFSGLPELIDEALMLVLAHRFHWLDYGQGLEISFLSNNPFFQMLQLTINAS